MATNTRTARKEAQRKRQKYFDSYFNRFVALFHNSVVIENADDLPKRYLLRTLRQRGRIAYDKETGLYLPCVDMGIDVYGLPTAYQLIGYNGFTVQRSPDQVVILRANDISLPIDVYLTQQIEKIVDFDMAIEQNLDAIKTMTIAEVKDQASLLSLANEYENRRLGATVVFKQKVSTPDTELKIQSTGATYLIDKLLEARKEIINETLSSIGISVANTDKKERVQTMEVIASQGYALDSLNTLVETFNYDAEQGGLTIRLRGNTSLLKESERQAEEGDEDNVQ
ncbi:MAG: hypothetical protein IKY67_06780 [Paludibacteraceae bacterium]|nr:hypothetical protein [Paludibacteraceae bacterium]